MDINKRLAVLGCISFLVFSIAILPARTVLALALPENVQAFGVQGSVWNGSARIINVGALQIRNTEWQVAIGKLLLGQLGGEFKTRWPGGFAEGTASVSASGTIRLTDTQAALDAGLLPGLLGTPPISGNVSLEVQELELQDNWPNVLTGRGEIRNLASPLMGTGNAGKIGNVAIEFTGSAAPEAGDIIGQISDTGGPLQIEGALKLAPPGNYDLETRVKARPKAPAALKNNLKFLGSPDADGNHVFKLAGSV